MCNTTTDDIADQILLGIDSNSTSKMKYFDPKNVTIGETIISKQ